MIIDNLTLSGLFVASLFALMPIMMGREFIRVRAFDEAADDATESTEKSKVKHTGGQQTVTRFTGPKQRDAAPSMDCIERS